MKNNKPKEQQIDVTTEYDVLKRLTGNREVDEAHVRKLMRKMKVKDLFTPIHVNQDFEVIDGQHRLEARKRLGLPVPYFWTDGGDLADVQELNINNKKWTNEDYMNSYIEQGSQDYKIYRWFRQQYGFSHTAALYILLHGTSEASKLKLVFQGGHLKVRSLQEAKKIAQMFLDIAQHFEHWQESKFVSAFLTVMQKEGFSFKTFLHRLSLNSSMLKPQTSIDGYLQNLEEVYNYKAQKKIPLRYAPMAEPKKKPQAML